MPRYLPVAIAAVVIGASIVFGMFRSYQNPDPNHTHADFAVWVNGQKLDFSGDQFMSEAYVEGQPVRVDPMRKYLHLHDGIGHVVHRHKPGLTLNDFFLSLGFTNACTLESVPESHRSEHVCLVFPDGQTHLLHVYINGQLSKAGLEYVFEDGDKILLSDSEEAAEIETQIDALTDDACLYSRTCPWRGDPPAENCIADPTIPCVVPE